MANPWRGDVALVIDGDTHVMRLTLGALAELEAAMQTDSLLAMVERFESSSFTSQDVLALLRAGLRGGKCDVPDDALLHAEIDGGPIGAARAAAELLARAFTAPQA
ncbi:gene transfer agent family protein [uncultured Roseobacter sp.]|uniref:gene transfer agent family protein n=1 Tax=uncultured Roseobacter sp. TaxID=114847 RepID=UPI002637FB39|nr:gene transfer agent family protein [uncultured Roseobacter sp.]